MVAKQMTFCGQPQWLVTAVTDGKKTVQQIGASSSDSLRKMFNNADRVRIDPVMEIVKWH